MRYWKYERYDFQALRHPKNTILDELFLNLNIFEVIKNVVELVQKYTTSDRCNNRSEKSSETIELVYDNAEMANELEKK